MRINRNKTLYWKNGMSVVFVVMVAIASLFSHVDRVHALGNDSVPITDHVVNYITYSQLTEGVNKHKIVSTTSNQEQQVAYTVEVDMSKAKIISSDSYPSTSAYALSTVRSQAEQLLAQGVPVVAGVNADFFAGDGMPVGVYVKDGVVYKDTSLANDPNFFAIKQDGSAMIAPQASFNSVKDDIKHAVGAYHKLVVNGVAQTSFQGNSETDASIHSRTAVGIKADGSVIFYAIDGKQMPYSKGVNLKDLAKTMKELGAVEAVNLDGGGSTTLVSRKLGSSEFQVDNVPSDGNERKISNSLLVVSKTNADGQFYRADITPEHTTYLPLASVQMKAIGYDRSGGSASLPSQLTWEVSDPTIASIDRDGKVTSKTVGQVQIILRDNNQTIIGSTWIEFQNPTSLQFKNNQISVEPSNITNLNIEALYEGRLVSFNSDDIQFTCDASLGSIQGFQFQATNSMTQGTIEARLGSLYATLAVQVGQVPFIIEDFENDLQAWGNATTAGVQTAISLAHDSQQEPVRFGRQALRFDFDFTSANPASTNGAYAGFKDIASGKGIEIPNQPTKIGMWVYADENAQGYWLRGNVRDRLGSTKTIDFASKIDWIGWKYVEADVSKLNAPLSTFNLQTIRLMTTSSMVSAGLKLTKGTLYIDNIRAVYGSSNDDLDAPIVEPITMTQMQDTVTFSTTFKDYLGNNQTGINYQRIDAFIDGVKYTTSTIDTQNQRITLENVVLNGGEHEVEIVVRDNFGNETSQKQVFTIEHANTFQIRYAGDANASLNGMYRLDVYAKQTTNLNALHTKLKFSEGYSIDYVDFTKDNGSTYTFEKGILDATIALEASANEQCIASIYVKIPATIKKGEELVYEPLLNQVNEITASGMWTTTYISKQAVPIEAPLQVQVVSTVIGRNNVVKVVDQNGIAVANAVVTIAFASGSFTATTNQEGLAYPGKFSGPGTVALQVSAKKDDQLSFIESTQSYIAFHANPAIVVADQQSSDPFNVILNASSLGAKKISWFSSVIKNEDKAIIQYQLKDISSDLTSYIEVQGTTTEQLFNGSATLNNNGVVRINQVELTDLKPNAEYVYRVGDGVHFSSIKTFSTVANDQTNFIVLGDTQTSDTTALREVLHAVDQDNKTYDFAVHVGDLVDNAGYFSDLREVNKAFGDSQKISTVDVLHTLGNHEYMGDNDALAAKTYYQLPMGSQSVYSYQKEDVYVAVLSWTADETALRQQLEWIKQDKAKYNKKWTILVTHQPIYYTNPDGGNGLFLRVVPEYAKAIGIDLVFSGHDHAYGRTSEIDGTTYIVNGSTGTKYYDAKNDGSFEVYNDERKAMYTSVTIEDTTLTLQALRADGTIIDTYTKRKEAYQVTTEVSTGGHLITEDAGNIVAGTNRVYELQAEPGYIVDTIIVNGVEQVATSKIELLDVRQNQLIQVQFKDVRSLANYTITDTYILYAKSIQLRRSQWLGSKQQLEELLAIKVYDKATGVPVQVPVTIANFDKLNNQDLQQVIQLQVEDDTSNLVQVNLVITEGNIPTLNVPVFQEVKQNDTFDERSQVTLRDVEDADIQSKLKIIGRVDTNKAGIYTLLYEVMDADGNKVSLLSTVLVNDGNYVEDNGYILYAHDIRIAQGVPLDAAKIIELANVQVYDIHKSTYISNPSILVDMSMVKEKAGFYQVIIQFNPRRTIIVEVIQSVEPTPGQPPQVPIVKPVMPPTGDTSRRNLYGILIGIALVTFASRWHRKKREKYSI